MSNPGSGQDNNQLQANGQHDAAQGNLFQMQAGFQITQQQQQQPSPPLSDLMGQLEDYTPTIPDSVTSHYLSAAGFDTADPRLLRLVSLAAQKFVSDVANDALTHCKMRQANMPSKKGKEKRYVMTSEDLASALGEQGVTVKKPPYYQ